MPPGSKASRVKSLKAQVEMSTPVPYQLPFVKKPLPQNSTEAFVLVSLQQCRYCFLFPRILAMSIKLSNRFYHAINPVLFDSGRQSSLTNLWKE
jgi:hypothetical protein